MKLFTYLPNYFLYLLFFGVLFFSCRANRHAGYKDQKDLGTLINRMQKRGDDPVVLEDIKRVYSEAYYKSIIRLRGYELEPAPDKWNKIIPELQSLQNMHQIISRNAYAYREIKPANYASRLILSSDSAASDYYMVAEMYPQKGTRAQNKEAYQLYQQAAKYVTDYRNSRSRMNELYNASIIHVLINPVEQDAVGWGFTGLPVFNQQTMDIQTRLIQNLGAQTAGSIPAKFYTPYQLRSAGRMPDLAVDMVWRNLRVDYFPSNNRTYTRSKQIQTGRDTANRPLYTTVYAYVNVQEQVVEASGNMHLLINEIQTRNQLAWEQYPADYRLNFETASYSGDKRALTEQDWRIINRGAPLRSEVMGELLEKVYQRLQNRIRQVANW